MSPEDDIIAARRRHSCSKDDFQKSVCRKEMTAARNWSVDSVWAQWEAPGIWWEVVRVSIHVSRVVICHMSFDACHMSFVTCHMSFVTYYLDEVLFVTCHMSFVTCYLDEVAVWEELPDGSHL